MKLFLSILAICIPFATLAQTEVSSVEIETTKIHNKETLDSVSNPQDIEISLMQGNNYNVGAFNFKPQNLGFYNRATSMPNVLTIPNYNVLPGITNITTWENGRLFASGTQRNLPGLMQIDHGAIGISQTAGKFYFYAGISANKYGYFQGLHTQYGVNGSTTFTLNPKISFTLFGNYYFGGAPYMANGMPMSPAMLGYYETNKYGGYMDYQATNHFGVLVGGQTVQQTGTHHYRDEPIVTPYVKVGKIGIGLPVGQILNGFLGR